MDSQFETDENALIRQLKNGDHAAFQAIYDRFKRPQLAHILYVVKSADLAEEVLQDLFVKVWQNRANIDPDKSFKGYLITISSNLIYDMFRKVARDRRLREHFMASFEETYVIDDPANLESEFSELHQALALLPPQRRRVVVMCKLEEKSYREVSEILNISTATVNDHIRQANIFLKKHFRIFQHVVVIITSLQAIFSR
ncbi:MAG: RNA polymerase sigma factor [Dyadobacter fermentans]